MPSPIESSPGLKTVTTGWAAEYIGRTRDTHVRTLLKNSDLSSRSERTEASIPDGYVSWWEMVRLDAYEHLRVTTTRSKRVLRDGLILLPIPLKPFVVVWSAQALPVLVRPDQVIDYQKERSSGAYDPKRLLRALEMIHYYEPTKSHHTGRPQTQQPRLFDDSDQLGLFDDG